MSLTIVTSSEVERGGVAASHSVTKGYGPKAGDNNRTTQLVIERAKKRARAYVEGVDLAVAEVADQERVSKRAETGGRDCYSPRRIERAIRNQTTEEVTVCIELTDETISWSVKALTRYWIDLRIEDVERASQVLYVERSKIHRDARICEASSQSRQRKAAVVDVDLLIGKVCGVEEVRHPVITYGESCIDVARVTGQNAGNGSCPPGNDVPSDGSEHESRRTSAATGRNDKVGTSIGDGPGGKTPGNRNVQRILHKRTAGNVAAVNGGSGGGLV